MNAKIQPAFRPGEEKQDVGVRLMTPEGPGWDREKERPLSLKGVKRGIGMGSTNEYGFNG